ncbi:MAG TPA: M48 family metallopeptidase [Rhizomicrobium sp.]|jgi:STE24 endopeptidase|nr:M48 family metallopeptidase [Rhizomicrobium sp.]
MSGWLSALRVAVVSLLLASAVALPVAAQPAAAPTSPVSVQPLPPATAPATVPVQPAVKFDALKATNAYLATVKGEARAKSDAYFEGGYVLSVVDVIYALAVAGILLWLHISSRMRDFAGRITRSRFWQVPIYVVLYLAITTVLTFPLTLYEGFFREHAYGLSNQDFGGWFGDFAKDFGVSLIAFVVVATVIYAVVRATPRFWWVWGTLVALVFVTFFSFVAPVFIMPMFNDYYSLKDGPVKQSILALARANEIPATDVYEFNASKQSKRISANVSGFAGTTRISLTDNLIIRCTPAEIKAVLGHEMGHYVLDHNFTGLTWFGLIFVVGFAFVNWGYLWLTGIFGGSWGVRTIDDPAGLPVIMALFSVFMLLATPLLNTATRTLEAQADAFGLNAAREPDGFATVTLKLSEYRKLDPSPLEEFVFYDHPSGRSRIFRAMTWKAEHLNDADIKAGPVSPQ